MYPRALVNVLVLLLLAFGILSCEKKKSTEPQNQCATPVLSPSGEVYADAQSVSISCATVGATIVYTTDGSDPTASSAVYSSPLEVSANTTVKAKAFRTGWIDSQIAASSYTIMHLVLVEGGTFNNGTSDVTVSSFYLGKYELTQSEYQAVMGSNPASGWGMGSNYPVYSVCWYDAIEYCNRRSINEGLSPCYTYSTYGTNPSDWPAGWNTSDDNHTNVSCSWTANGYRLPTNAEWEFAARGGNLTHNYTYSGSNDIDAVAWYTNNTGETSNVVGTRAPNELGLFDMSGNVFEWNWDIHGDYPNGAQTNPHGPVSGFCRETRSGSWGYTAYYCTVSYHGPHYPTDRGGVQGFRVCRNSP